MIWTVTANPALDITYRVPALEYGETHRVESVTERPGGKGLNVGLVARQLGDPVTFTGFLGGATGDRVALLLRDFAPDASAEWIRVPRETRRSIAVVDANATVFNEAGTTPDASAWDSLTSTVADGVRPGDVVAVSGSMPAGTSPRQLAAVLSAARESGGTVILDTSGEYLSAAAGLADIVKPNARELLEATGADDLGVGAAVLLDQGTRCVLVSRGADGLDAFTSDGHWHATIGQVLAGNPTGAGDAAVAAVAHCARAAQASGQDALSPEIMPELLTDAVATSAAAVVCPVAGEIDLNLRAQLLQSVTIERISDAR